MNAVGHGNTQYIVIKLMASLNILTLRYNVLILVVVWLKNYEFLMVVLTQPKKFNGLLDRNGNVYIGNKCDRMW